MRLAASFAIGLLFGLGLVISGMTNPAKIISFLDVAGEWDPSLALVMAAALSVSFVGYRAAFARGRPALAETFSLPTKTAIDRPLLMGAGLFGVGWGLSGLCPGPAVAAAASFEPAILMFFAAMVAGVLVHDRIIAPPRRLNATTIGGAG